MKNKVAFGIQKH